MKKIGLTGGIGSGKTTVSSIFKHLGVPVYIADIKARELMNGLQEIKNEIANAFGGQVLVKGEINRAELARIVFADPNSLKTLNSIIHPYVYADFENWCRNYSHEAYVIEEAAILFETGSNAKMDRNIVVSAHEKLRIDRVIARDACTVEDVKARMKNQMPQEEKVRMADFIVGNNGEALLEQILKIHQNLIND